MTFTPALPVAWTEIPVADLDAGTAFYEAVTGCRLERQSMGPNETAVFSVSDPPMSGGGVHLSTPAHPRRGGHGPHRPSRHRGCAGKTPSPASPPRGGTVVSPPIRHPGRPLRLHHRSRRQFLGLFEAAAALMRRADRLFQIVQHLARRSASSLPRKDWPNGSRVSPRTI